MEATIIFGLILVVCFLVAVYAIVKLVIRSKSEVDVQLKIGSNELNIKKKK
jgi:hypothetical protein